MHLSLFPRRTVFPTGVGMFLRRRGGLLGGESLPHRRGDVSLRNGGLIILKGSSPQAWGCFSKATFRRKDSPVFPTGVGMFLDAVATQIAGFSLPHRRGDVSSSAHLPLFVIESSPQAWGCFPSASEPASTAVVFPTGVGMFLDVDVIPVDGRCLPHRRGDVSRAEEPHVARLGSSPQAWGCFRRANRRPRQDKVFPTGVGMFLHKRSHESAQFGLPHGRGDVSGFGSIYDYLSSPRAWGCFSGHCCEQRGDCVFPTGEGMFPSGAYTPDLYRSLPHGRGDVSFSGSRPRDLAASSPRAWGCFPATSR